MCHRDLFKVTGDGAKDRRKVSEEEDYEEEALGRTQHHEERSGGWVYEVEEAVAEYDEVLAAYSDESQSTASEQRMLPSGCHGAGDKGLLAQEGLKGKGKFEKGKSSHGKQGPPPPKPVARGKAAFVGGKPAKFEVWRIWT